MSDGARGFVPAMIRSAFLVDAVYARSARDHGLTAQQGQLLCVLMGRPYGMGELSQTLLQAKSSMSGLVERTERLGLVQRTTDGDDGRTVRVALTPKGARLARRFYDETSRRVDALIASFDGDQRRRVTDLLATIADGNDVPAVFSPDE